MEVIDFIIVVGLILYVVPLLFRIVTRMLLQRLVSKAQQHTQQNYRQNASRPADGRIRVDYAPKVKSQIPDSEGDFIDYEEIK